MQHPNDAPAHETLERILPWELDPSDPTQAAILASHMQRYRIAAQHVAGKHVLDVACGVGYGSAMLADGGATSVIGCDIDASAIHLAQERYTSPTVTFRCSPYQELPHDESFDVVVSIETIEHLPEPADFLRFVRQALPDGGTFIGSVPTTPSVDFNPHHLHDFTRGSMARSLRRSGFTVVDEHVQVEPVSLPLALRALVSRNGQVGQRNLRPNIPAFYLRHPRKLVRRVLNTLRYGLDVRYWLFIARAS